MAVSMRDAKLVSQMVLRRVPNYESRRMMFESQKLETLRAKYSATASNEIFDPHFRQVANSVFKDSDRRPRRTPAFRLCCVLRFALASPKRSLPTSTSRYSAFPWILA